MMPQAALFVNWWTILSLEGRSMVVAGRGLW